MANKITIDGYPKSMELQKRFPIPAIHLTCEHCKKEITVDDVTTDYPKLDRPEEIYFLCPKCDEEITLKVKIAVTVTPVV